MADTAAATAKSPHPAPFSEQLRSATRDEHEEAELHAFTQALLHGRLPIEGYASMAAQHYFAYTALEEVGRTLAADPLAGRFVHPGLARVGALEQDLADLLGPAWRSRIEPSPPTRAYAARIRRMADHPDGYVAHHYTRYLGDLSGGQFIRRIVEDTYGLTGGRGTAFYRFDRLPSPPRFKAQYRALLDGLGLGEDARARIIEEARLAYRLNTEVLADLGRRHLDGSAD